MTDGKTPKKPKGKSPAAQFYWADWLRDPALRSVSSGARGLWIDILCLMWECVPKGHLQTRTGQPFSVEMICRMTGNISEEEVNRWLLELEHSGVTSHTATGVLFSRRMVRDEHKRAACREAGKRGGNPTLKGGVKGRVKGGSKGRSKRKPTPSSSTSVEDGRSPDTVPPTLEAVSTYCRERGNSVDPERWMDFYSAKGWMIGKNRMTDWRAAVRTWEKDDGPQRPSKPDLFAGLREAAAERGFTNDGS